MIDDKYTYLTELRGKLVNIGLFSSNQDEIQTYDEVLDAVLEFETTPTPIDNETALKINLLEKNLESCEISKATLADKLSKLSDRNKVSKVFEGKLIGIVGGHLSEIKKLESILKEIHPKVKVKSTFKDKKDGCPSYQVFKNKYQSADALIVITSYAGHSLTGLADKLEKEQGKYVYRTNQPSQINSIIEALVSLFE